MNSKQKNSKSSVQLTKKEPEQSKKTNSDKGSQYRKITAPELPGSMKYMLADEKGEDSELVSIQVTFFPRNIMEINFLVKGDSTTGGQPKKMTPSEYDMYKEAHRLRQKAKREEEAANGWLKKLSTRALLFPKPTGQGDVIRMMNVTPVPEVLQGIMSMTQTEFTAKYPNPDAILSFWFAIPVADHAKVVLYGSALGVDYAATLKELKAAKDDREKRKAEKSARALAVKSKSRLQNPSVSWADEEEKHLASAKQGIKPPVAVATVDVPSILEGFFNKPPNEPHKEQAVRTALLIDLIGQEDAYALLDFVDKAREDLPQSELTNAFFCEQYEAYVIGKEDPAMDPNHEEEESSGTGKKGIGKNPVMDPNHEKEESSGTGKKGIKGGKNDVTASAASG